MRQLTLLLLFVIPLYGPLAAPVLAQHWPQWRGPDGSGVIADELAVPQNWSSSHNIAWKTMIPGLGWSSPIIWGDRVFVTSVIAEEASEGPQKGLYLPQGRPQPPPGTHRWMVYCLDLHTGRVLWEHKAHEGRPQSPRHPKNSFASETPVTDGQRVYVLFGDLGLFAYEMEGRPAWSRRFEPRQTPFGWGAGASPALLGDQLIVVYDNEEQSFIASFDTSTGEEKWRTARDEKSTWATPFIWRNELRTEIVTSGRAKIRSYDPQGNLLWSLAGRMSTLAIPTPIAAHGMVYLNSGYIGDTHRPAYAIRPGAQGDLTPDEEGRGPFIAWYQPRAGAYHPSALVYGDVYYTLLDGGFLTAHDARTGAEIYGRQRIEPGATFTASPWAVNGNIFLLSEDATTYVVQAGPHYRLLGKNVLDPEMALASPAATRGRLLIRTASTLYCIHAESAASTTCVLNGAQCRQP
jgi:outer membrane protein assembly factor BamB